MTSIATAINETKPFLIIVYRSMTDLYINSASVGIHDPHRPPPLPLPPTPTHHPSTHPNPPPIHPPQPPTPP